MINHRFKKEWDCFNSYRLELAEPKLLYLSLVLLLLFTQQTFLHGQSRIYSEQIKKEDGSQLGHVFDVFEDDLGFIWFCTNDGLAKYDGYTFQYYRHNKDEENSLSSSWIFAGLKDSKGRIWAGTKNGLNLMNRQTEKFQRFYYDDKDSTTVLGHRIRDIFEDSKGRIWIGSYIGISYYDEAKKIFCRIKAPSFEGSRHSANIMEDKEGNILVTSIKGLYKVDKKRLSAKQILPLDPLQSAAANLIVGCFEDNNGILWLTSMEGIWQYDPVSNNYSRLKLSEDLIDRSYGNIVEYPKNHLMIASFDVGLICINQKTNQLDTKYNQSAFKTSGLALNSTYCLGMDSRNNLWLGLFHGVNKINLLAYDLELYTNTENENDLRNYTLRIYSDPDGGVWSNTMRGVFYRPKLNQSAISITDDFLEANRYFPLNGFCMDHQKKLWFGLRRVGLYNYDLQTNTVNKIDNFAPEQDFQYIQIVCDHKNQDWVWVSGELGLYRYNQSTKKGRWFSYPKEMPENNGNTYGKMLQDSSGNLWILQNNSLWYFNTKNQTFKRHPLPQDQFTKSTRIVALNYQNNTLWVTTGDALYHYIESSSRFAFFSTNDGISDYGIASMQCGDNGRFWFGQNGITSYDPNTKTSQNYKISHKAEDLIFGFSSKTSDGHLLFPSTNGILAFHPDEVKIDSIPPKIMLRNIKVNNELLLTDKAYEFIDHLTLSWNDKIVTFEYVGLKFSKTSQLQYKIMLEGFDKNWRAMGNKRDATYTNLQPGRYIFKILAANADDIWTKTPKILSIKVLPPFWRTKWFYALFTLVTLGIIYSIFNNYKTKQKLSKEKAIAEQSTRYKSLFLANMSHEIRTPMNTILGMNNLMLDTDLNFKQHEYAEIISQSSENLLVIINDILDHSKIESGKYTFTRKPFDLDKIISLLYGVFEPKAKEKKLQFSIKLETQTPLYLKGDAIRLKQILINLIGNAIKFTEKGKVTLSIRKVENKKKQQKNFKQLHLLFEIKDTGVGIPEELKERIFESFERAVQSGGKEIAGTGLGLSIASQLVVQQGGLIWLDSQSNQKGSVFSFILPFVVLDKSFSVKKKVFNQKILKKYSFLIVEDSFFNQKLLEELLKKYFPNATIEMANNGQEAVSFIVKNDYDLVFMDVKMPVMDGFEATRKIRSLDDVKKQQTKIVAVTANAISSQLKQCKEAGMDAYITKPIEAKEMLSKIIELLNLKD